MRNNILSSAETIKNEQNEILLKKIREMDCTDLSENQQISVACRNDIIELCIQGKLYEHIAYDAIELERDSGGKVTKVIFAIGGPYIYLDTFSNPGHVITQWSSNEDGQSSLPLCIVHEILEVVEEFDYVG